MVYTIYIGRRIKKEGTVKHRLFWADYSAENLGSREKRNANANQPRTFFRASKQMGVVFSRVNGEAHGFAAGAALWFARCIIASARFMQQA